MGKKQIILITVIFVLILAISGGVYYFLKKEIPFESIRENQGGRKESFCLGKNERAEFKIKRLGEYPSDDYNRGFIEITVKEIDTNQEISKFKINDIINPSHYHPIELHKCGVYVIREFNFDLKTRRSTPNYSSSLWKYDYQSYKIEILKFSSTDSEGKYTSFYNDDFRIDPQERYLVLERGYLGKDDYSLVIKNLNTKEDIFTLTANEIIKQYPNLIGNFDMRDWTRDGRYFWGAIQETAYVNGYFRIDVENWKTDIFEVPEGVGGGDALNIERGLVTRHPGYIWTGMDVLTEQIKQEWREQGKKSTLYLYNLFTKEQILLATTTEPLWFFQPKWLSDTELEYKLPTGEKKVYKIQ